MPSLKTLKLPTSAAMCALLLAGTPLSPQQPPPAPADAPHFPYPETLSYHVEWRLVTAGNATLRLTRAAQNNWQTDLDVVSAGFVNRLFHVQDTYKLVTTDKFCGVNLNFDAQEGKHHVLTTLAFDNDKRKLTSTIKDFSANTHKAEFVIPACTYDIMGALMSLRAAQLDPGLKTTLPVTDGKKLASVRIEAQAKEKLTIAGKSFNTVRCEAFVFDGVLYRRKGRLFIWMTDDPQHLPVQMRFQLSFPIGDITLELEKVEKL